MRWQRRELAVLKVIELKEELHIAPSLFASNKRLIDLKDIWVTGFVKYDAHQDIVYVDLLITGIMVCPCALTNVEVDYPFTTECSEIFGFNQAEEYSAYVIEGDELDLLPIVEEIILQEVPIKVVKKGKIDYPKGNGWQVTTEADYAKQKLEKTDPRLAILKNYQFNDKEE